MKPSEILKFSRSLWAHQAGLIDDYSEHRDVALLHEVGTGKTTSAIGWLRWKYREANEVLPTLLFSPKATLYNWLREFELNSPTSVSSQVRVLKGSGKERAKQLLEGKIFITNYESLGMADFIAAAKLRRFVVVGADEAQRLKNYKSKRVAALLPIADAATHRIVLTGTPITQAYLDLWAVWRFLDRGETFGQNFFVFRARYFRDRNAGMPKGRYFPDWVPLPGIEDELAGLVARKASRAVKAECLDLPPLTFASYPIPLSAEQRRLYDAMETELIAYIKSDACVVTNALTKSLRLMQIVSGHIMLEGFETATRIKDNPRAEALEDILEDNVASKAIIWCTFTADYEVVKGVCDKLGLGYSMLVGGVKDAQMEIDEFQNNARVRIMIANPKAGGVGVNLTAASMAIYYSRNFSSEERQQSIARCYRGGSEIHEKITVIDLFAPDTIEEDVMASLERKEEYAKNILERVSLLQARKLSAS